jgi:hypothetical protein
VKVVTWIASVTLGALALFFITVNLFAPSMPSEKVPLLIHLLAACIFAAAVLLFPPFWRGETAAKWKWPRVIAAVILAAIGFLSPVKTHAVKLDMPAPHSPSGH